MDRITFPLEPGRQGKAVADLQDGLRLLLGKDVYPFDEADRQALAERLRIERAAGEYDHATRRLVQLFQAQRELESSGAVDGPTARALNAILEELGAFNAAESVTFRVEGRVLSRVRAGVEGLQVHIVDKVVGDDVLIIKTVTDRNGAYRVTFADDDLRRRGKDKFDLQARVFAGDRFLAASDVRYDATPGETLNIFVNERASSVLRSEHETLLDNISDHFPGRLSELREIGERRDVTYLSTLR